MPHEIAPPKGPPPLRQPTFYILLALAQEKKHGYAILKDVEKLSERRVRLSTGTLYGALGRLLSQGMIRKVEAGELELGQLPGEGPTGTEAGRPRIDYELTQAGRRLLEAEAHRLQNLLDTARLRLGLEGVK